MLGAVAGGAVRIAEAAGGLVVAEGIETALSLASGLLGRPTTIWAAPLGGAHQGTMRADDHQFQQPLVVSVMARAGSPGVPHDVEGSGYGFRTVRRFEAPQVELPHTCRMSRP
jgi:branched-chain amino acid transport system substrate-binding protein